MARQKGITTKSVYIEVSNELWGKIKIVCFNKSITLKKFVTELVEKEIKKGAQNETNKQKMFKLRLRW